MIIKINYYEIPDNIKNHNEAKKNLITFYKNGIYFGYCISDKIVGCVGFIESKNYIKFGGSFVLPEYRNIGIYKALCEKRMGFVRSIGKPIYANCTKYSINLHIKNGAKIIKEFKTTFKIIYEV